MFILGVINYIDFLNLLQLKKYIYELHNLYMKCHNYTGIKKYQINMHVFIYRIYKRGFVCLFKKKD